MNIPQRAASPGGLIPRPASETVIDAEPISPLAGKRRNIKWGRLCGLWFLLVLLYMLAGSKRVPPEEVPAMVEQTQLLMGIALLPAIVRIYYRRFFSD
jgi:hypothetical protein